MVSFPVLRMFSGGAPEVALAISSFNRYTANVVQVVAYSGDHTHESDMVILKLQEAQASVYRVLEVEYLLREPGVETAAIVLTSDSTFVVSFTYAFPYQGQDLFTSSILYPVGPASSHYFIVTSTGACQALPVTGNPEAGNPIVSSPHCICETFLLVIAVETRLDVTDIKIEFPPDSNLTFELDDIELGDPSYMRIPIHFHETIFVTSDSDLSGTFIEASQQVAVYSGYAVKV